MRWLKNKSNFSYQPILTTVNFGVKELLFESQTLTIILKFVSFSPVEIYFFQKLKKVSETLGRGFAVQVPNGNQTAALEYVQTGEFDDMKILEKYSNENETWVELSVPSNVDNSVNPKMIQRKIRENSKVEVINVYPRGWLDLLDYIKELNRKPKPPPQTRLPISRRLILPTGVKTFH